MYAIFSFFKHREKKSRIIFTRSHSILDLHLLSPELVMFPDFEFWNIHQYIYFA